MKLLEKMCLIHHLQHIVLVVVLNRLNVGIIGLLPYTGNIYVPSWMELVVTLTLAIGACSSDDAGKADQSAMESMQSKLQEEWFQQFSCMEPDAVKEVYQGAFTGLESSNHLMVRWDELNQIWNNTVRPFLFHMKDR